MATTAQLPAEVLPRLPALRGLYGRALARSVRETLARGTTHSGTSQLPRLALEVHGVRPERDEVTAYQRLLGETVTDGLPAGFVHVLGFPLAVALMVRPDFPLPVIGLVHVANTVHHHRVVSCEEVLDLRVFTRRPRAHRRGTQFEVVLQASVGAERVWEGISTYLAPTRRLPGLPEAPPRQHPTATTAPATAQWRIEAGQAREYAAVSGDRNPIHTSVVGARLFGFHRPIAHGMYTAARALAAVGPRRGENFTWEVDFAKPVMLPATVLLSIKAQPGATFTYTGRAPRGERVHFSGTVRRH